MKFNKILIVGCSYSSGHGFSNGRDEFNLWPNQLARKLNATTINNAAEAGANNHWIFLKTVSELIKNDYDLILVEWSAIPRYRFNVGLELYPVNTLLGADVNIVGGQTIKKSWLSEIKDRLLKIHNDHWDILDLIKYINVLVELQVKSRNKHIFFINGLCPWPDQYFTKKQIKLPSDLDSFTYNILQPDLRDDSDTFRLYEMIHNQYNDYGGIQEKYWLNLYQSQATLKIDTVSKTDKHPGINSQTKFSEYFYEKILTAISNKNND